MAVTTYSSAFGQLPQSPTKFEDRSTNVRYAGIQMSQYFRVNVPIGTVTTDIINLCSINCNVPVAVPQIAGVRFKRVVLRSSANAGGSMTFNFGYVGNATAFGAALTTIQSATILDVAVATVAAAGPILQNTLVQMVMVAAGPTTTACVVDGWIDYLLQAP